MVGRAVATMVWLSAARNIASMRPNTMVRISSWLSTQRPGCGPDCGSGIFVAAIRDMYSVFASLVSPGVASNSLSEWFQE